MKAIPVHECYICSHSMIINSYKTQIVLTFDIKVASSSTSILLLYHINIVTTFSLFINHTWLVLAKIKKKIRKKENTRRKTPHIQVFSKFQFQRMIKWMLKYTYIVMIVNII